MKITEYMTSDEGINKDYLIFVQTDYTRKMLKAEIIDIMSRWGATISSPFENRLRIVEFNVNIIFALSDNRMSFLGLNPDMIFIHTFMEQEKKLMLQYYFIPRGIPIKKFRY